MAVSLSCNCSNGNLIGSRRTDYGRSFSPSGTESAVPSLPPSISSGAQGATEFTPPVAAHTKERFADDGTSSSSFTRWATMVVAAAAGATVMAAAPAVLAADRDVLGVALPTYSIPVDLSLSIAIPIPESERWENPTMGFLAPPLRTSGSALESVVVMNYEGGCPAWQPGQFETIVPDGVHPKNNPRHGNQWPASNTEETAPIQHQVMDSAEDAPINKSSLIEALLRMSDAGLTCFSL